MRKFKIALLILVALIVVERTGIHYLSKSIARRHADFEKRYKSIKLRKDRSTQFCKFTNVFLIYKYKTCFRNVNYTLKDRDFTSYEYWSPHAKIGIITDSYFYNAAWSIEVLVVSVDGELKFKYGDNSEWLDR